MGTIGYHRYKYIPTESEDITFSVGGEIIATKRVELLESCQGDRIIKFINNNGQYTFFAFNRFYSVADKPKEIGRSNNIITSLKDSQSDEFSIGYRNKRTLTLVSDAVAVERLAPLSDLWSSPRIYLYVGDGTSFQNKDYILVSLTSKRGQVKVQKENVVDISVTIVLPKHYSITML